MIVAVSATIAIPIAFVEHSAFIAWPDPTRAAVGRTRPISVVPSVSPAIGIPVAVYPDVSKPGTAWLNPDDPWRRRSPNSDSDRDLRTENGTSHHECQS